MTGELTADERLCARVILRTGKFTGNSLSEGYRLRLGERKKGFRLQLTRKIKETGETK